MAKAGQTVIADPLATVRLYLKLNPNQPENQALRRLLTTLADAALNEPIRDATLFEGELGELTAALLDARLSGRYSAAAWHQAATD